MLRNVRATDVPKLIDKVQQVGRRLVAAQPKELAVGNIVRRILGLIRDEAEEDRDGEAGGYGDMGIESRYTWTKERYRRILLTLLAATQHPPLTQVVRPEQPNSGPPYLPPAHPTPSA